MNKVRVRYAPSPTGFLHIGNARTALFNYLFARHYEGTFIIRIEDTDLERNIKQSEEAQLKELKWLGLEWQEGPDCGGTSGPYRQSERLTIYQKYAQFLLANNLAYKEYTSYSSSKFVIRFKVPNKKIFKFYDLIRGELTFYSQDIEDWIIIKENGFPTYNYAVAIDDYLMQISHIFRGEEHITNTPKQIMVYQAFGWKIPTFAHMSLILNTDKKKLSKRDNNIIQFIQKYIDLGYLPEALFNFLSLLGFSPLTNETILSPQKIIQLFDIKRLVKAPAIFDFQKLSFINNQYLKKMPLLELVKRVKVFFQREKIIVADSWLTKFVALFQNRIACIQETVTLYYEFFSGQQKIDQLLYLLKHKVHLDLIKNLYYFLDLLPCLTVFELKKTVKQLQTQTNLKVKDFFMTIRIACTGKMHGPALLEYLELLGKEKILNNINNVISCISRL
ncbi:glutamate--tRNA ligase [Candidatus Phytoplasma phoenicium]|uniref:Glutamate--tRNA ligase n=1 Tax=Candidatus Phytoplasma phoenicium TaxID=198422 RepID=A0A2S8NU67_9MOLU|nr:glutamate--tRNA ligase [Candidatus Phytoplasma phoenicium]